jgi:hypothetical protein
VSWKILRRPNSWGTSRSSRRPRRAVATSRPWSSTGRPSCPPSDSNREPSALHAAARPFELEGRAAGGIRTRIAALEGGALPIELRLRQGLTLGVHIVRDHGWEPGEPCPATVPAPAPTGRGPRPRNTPSWVPRALLAMYAARESNPALRIKSPEHYRPCSRRKMGVPEGTAAFAAYRYGTLTKRPAGGQTRRIVGFPTPEHS